MEYATVQKTSRISKLKVGLVAVALGALLVVPSASADDSTMGVTVTGGTLTNTLSTTTDLPGVNYNHLAQTTSGVLAVGINDERGTEEGWSASLVTSDFVSTGTAPDIAAANLDITGQGTVTDSSGLGNSADVQQTDFTTPASIETATVIANAANASGAGNFAWNANMTLNVPAGQYADTYTGTVTLTTAAPIV